MKASKWMTVVLTGLAACAIAQDAPPSERGMDGPRRRMAGPMSMDPEGMIMRALAPDSKLAQEIGMTEEQSASLKKLFAEVCLLEQGFVKEEKTPVAQMMASVAKEAGCKLELVDFVYAKVGEA